jgi:catechol 2,3-dioxygenase-like lactoylglutathione lyase family enzyme
MQKGEATMRTPTFSVEVVTLPVSDVERALRFYVDQVGFVLDVDFKPNDAFRVVQLTPPGSSCSIQIGKGLTNPPVGSVRYVYLVVTDLEPSRNRLLERRVEVRLNGLAAYFMRWSPDHRVLRFTLTLPDRNLLAEVSADGTGYRRLLEGWHPGDDITSGNWSPDGALFTEVSRPDSTPRAETMPASPIFPIRQGWPKQPGKRADEQHCSGRDG